MIPPAPFDLQGNKWSLFGFLSQHEDICKFPSEKFYEGKLKTGVERPASVLRVDDRVMPVVFGHIEGKTIKQVVKTAKGNNNSKANNEERDQVVLFCSLFHCSECSNMLNPYTQSFL